MVLLLGNIPAPHTIERYNAINRVWSGQLMVWYQHYREPNRVWRVMPRAHFQQVVLGRRWWSTLWSLCRELNRQREQIEAVIIRGWNTLAYLYTVAWCRYHHVPLVLWSGSTAWEKHWLRPLVAPIVRWVISCADAYLAYGSRARAYLISLGADPTKVRIFWNSVDLTHFARARRLKQVKARQDLHLPTNRRVVLFVGQLIVRKNVVPLIDAFQRVGRHYPQLHLVIAGVGPLATKIKPQVNLTLLGHQEYAELPRLYAAADVLILPSREEVWGLVVNEAMAAGRPCAVSVTAGAAADLIISGQTGWRLVPTQSGIESVLMRIAQSTPAELKMMGEQAAKLVRSTAAPTTARRLFSLKSRCKQCGK